MRVSCSVRDDVVALLEGAPNGGHEPAGSGEDVREVHVLEVRLRVASWVRFERGCLDFLRGRRHVGREPREVGREARNKTLVRRSRGGL